MSNFETDVTAADHAKRKRDNAFGNDEMKTQSTFFRSPDEEKRCVYRAGVGWRNNLRRKRIHQWKTLNFLGIHKMKSYLEPDESDDEQQHEETRTHQNSQRTNADNTANHPPQK